MAPSVIDRRQVALREVFATCRAFGISRADRLDWATVVLNRTIETFRDLGPDEAERLLDAAHGATYMAKIHMEYKSGERQE